MRFELMTSSLPRRRSTPELRGLMSNLSDCAFNLDANQLALLERATRLELATLSLEG